MTAQSFSSRIWLALFAVLLNGLLLGCSSTMVKREPGHIEHLTTVSTDACVAGCVILPPAKATNSWGFPEQFEPLWNPTTNLVTEVLSQIPDYLGRASLDQLSHPAYVVKLPGIRDRLPKSLCQIIGVTFEGHQAIFLNFLPPDDHWSKHWRDNYIKVHDGGPCFWSVVYLLEESRFTRLRIDLGGF